MDTINRINGVVLMDQIGATRTPYKFPHDDKIKFEDFDGQPQVYPGDEGEIYEFPMHITLGDNGDSQEYEVPVICFTGKLEKELEIARLVWGAEARNQYATASATFAKAVQSGSIVRYYKEMEDFFSPDTIGTTSEYLVLRAGRAMMLKPFFPELDQRTADCKRRPTQDDRLFQGSIKGKIDWGDEEKSIGDEICVASGANLEALFTDRVKNKGECKSFLLHSIFISIEGLRRSLPVLLKAGIKPIIVCWGGIFNVYKSNLTFSNGTVVDAGTLISIYPDSDPNNRAIMTEETYYYINSIYGHVPILPDLNGEVGEKIQDDLDLDVIQYDICELSALGIRFKDEPWKSKVKRAFEKSPEAFTKLARSAHNVYAYLVAEGLIAQNMQMPQIEVKSTLVEVKFGD